MSILYLHPLQTCYERLNRAEEHLDTFNKEMDAWVKSEVEVLREVNSDRTEYRYRAKLKSLPSPRLSLILGDCLHNLRASLDHLVYQLNGRPAPSRKTRRIAFPIFDSPTDYRSAVDQMLWRVSLRARTLIERLQPYHAKNALFSFGPPPLLVLYHLSNFDKHRDIHLVWAVAPRASVSVEEMPIEQHLPSVVLIDGAELGRFRFARPDVKMHPSFHFTVSVQVADLDTVVSIVYFRAILDLIRNQILPQFGLSQGLWGYTQKG